MKKIIKKTSQCLIGLLVLVNFGCALPSKITIRVNEKGHSHPVAGFARSLEIVHFDDAGTELFRRRVLVEQGLTKPAALGRDEMKGIDLSKKGRLIVLAKAQDGLLLLRGEEKTPQKLVEVTLTRDPALDQPMSSALHKIRFANRDDLASFAIHPDELVRKAADGKCVTLPEINVFPQAAYFPELVVEGNLAAMPLAYDVGDFDPATGDFRVDQELKQVPGQTEGRIAFDREFKAGALVQNPQHFFIRIFGRPFGEKKYIGCFEVNTMVELLPPDIGVFTMPGYLDNSDSGRPIGYLQIHNYNDVDLMVYISAEVKHADDRPLGGRVYYRFNASDIVPRTHNSHVEESVIRQEKLVPARSVLTLYLLGAVFWNGTLFKQHSRYDFKVITKAYPRTEAPVRFVKDLRLDLF